MSRLEDLPPDQQAALSLLLRRRESYAGLAGLLNITERAVHDRAHAALAMLAPRQARAVPTDRREQIGEFLLGQRQSDGDREATLSYLASDAGGRAWARALTAELSSLGDDVLPALPAETPATDDGAVGTRAHDGASAEPLARSADLASGAGAAGAAAAAARDRSSSPPVSRRAGALLLAVVVAAVVLAVILIPSGGHSSPKHTASTSAAAGAGQGGAGTTAGGGGAPTQDRRITLSPVDPKSSAIGVALVLSEGSRYAFYVAAQHLPPTHGFFYAVWLYNSPTSHAPLGKSPAVGSNGVLQGGTFLPSNAGQFHRMILTRETSEHPSGPGPIVLSGAFGLH
jgi:hypothetical protein